MNFKKIDFNLRKYADYYSNDLLNNDSFKHTLMT